MHVSAAIITLVMVFALRSAASASTESPERLEMYTTKEVRNRRTLHLERGAAVFVRTRIPLERSARSEVRVVPVTMRAHQSVSTAPWAEVIQTSPDYIETLYSVRGLLTGPAVATLQFVLEVRENSTGALLGRTKVQHNIQLRPPKATTDTLQLDHAAYLHHQHHAKNAYKQASELRSHLNLHKIEPLPPIRLVGPGRAANLEYFLYHRLRADIALAHLRASIEVEDEALALKAARLVGALSERRKEARPSARSIADITTGQALQLASQALDDIDLDLTEALTQQLRTSGRLTRPELAQTFALIGGTAFLRGRAMEAARAYGRALCLALHLQPSVQRPFLRRRLETARSTAACEARPSILEVTAERRTGDDGSVVIVDVTLSSDQHRLFSAGKILRWGPSGRPDLRRTAMVEHRDSANPHIVFELQDNAHSAAANQVVLEILLEDPSGVVLTRFGDPLPRSVTIANADAARGLQTPTWVWIVSGAVAVVGGTVASVLALQSRNQVQRVIGPVSVRF